MEVRPIRLVDGAAVLEPAEDDEAWTFAPVGGNARRLARARIRR